MELVKNILFKKIGTETTDSSIASFMCYIAAIGILIIGFLRISHIALSEYQIFFGIFLVLILSIQMVITGILLDTRSKIMREKSQNL